ncbi:hypothetical protein [Epilithonimonas sp. UC225_85]|uniref:hypothetical protein n=1 Tax=Epilithonimonas sp. UC225_85 TaxID=3350167 RepID=UPI0036D28E1C
MKQSEDLSHLSNEQLAKSYNTAKGIFIGFIIVFILLIGTAVFITLTKGFGVFTILPVVFISILVANVTNFNKLKAEMRSRNLLN